MAIIKCKMCGGNIEISADKTYGTCDSCGSTMTFPKVSDEQRVNLFNRANHFRRQNEFDKAIAAYERILEEDNGDAEAHWGVVLSRYGIEYVEDPTSHERIPTCHRVQMDSILTDTDYLSAKENAPDAYSAELYEKEAKQIAEIQKGILAISAQEEPYDVFICYKESTEGGSRTKDSTIAQDIYYQLTGEGYKVFFSRITLEDKLGKQYEPYIFAALNSAKVMLVIGTKPEHFSAVWVKNEWSRYLALMRQDRTKLLIPCYRDMDPYDLPEELSALQSQDMSKIGFIQDLLHGVMKVLDGDKAESAAASATAGPGVKSLLTRAQLFLEDGDFASANEYADKVLDIDPKYAPAYIVKVQVKEKVKKEADLAYCKQPLAQNADYQKAIRFADAQSKAVYEGYNQAIVKRIEEAKREETYQILCMRSKHAMDEQTFLQIAAEFERLGEFRDSAQRAKNCRDRAQTIREERAQREAEAKVRREQLEAEAKQRQEQYELERKRREEQERIAAEKRKKRNRKIARITIILLIIVAIAAGAWYFVVRPSKLYEQANNDRSSMKYDQAISTLQEVTSTPGFSIFSEIGGFDDAETIIRQCEADKLFASGDYVAAFGIYNVLDSRYQTHADDYEKMYQAAITQMENGEEQEAIAAFNSISNYSDSAKRIAEFYYTDAQAKLASGDPDAAREAFVLAGSYSDAQEMVQAIDDYNAAVSLMNSGDYASARSYFANLTILDSAEKLEACYAADYSAAEALYNDGDIAGAHDAFLAISEYSDSASRAAQIEADYNNAYALYEEGKYDEAIAAYAALGNYEESVHNGYMVHYQKGLSLWEKGEKLAAEEELAYVGEVYNVREDLAKLRLEIADEAFAAKQYDVALAHYILLEQTDDLKAKEYALAQTCYDEGYFAQAVQAYEVLGQYELSVSKLPVARYAYAAQLFENENYAEAAEQFALLNGSTDSAERATQSTYLYGKQLMEQKLWDDAKAAFAEVSAYEDAATLMKDCDYRKAGALMADGKLADAKALFESLKTYSDSATQAQECGYRLAEADLAAGNYAEAQKQYEALKGYSDSADKVKLCIYEQANTFVANGDYAAAEALYSSISEYEDSAEQVKLCRYEQGNACFTAQDYNGALEFYTDLGYSDSETLAVQCHCALGKMYLSAGKSEDAVREYAQATILPEAQEALHDIGKDFAATNQNEKAIETLWACGDYEPALKLLAEIAEVLEQSGNIVDAAIARYAIRSNSNVETILSNTNVDIAEGLSAYGILPGEPFVNAIWYSAGEAKREAGDWNGAAMAFKNAGSYSDAATQITETYYQHAQVLIHDEDYLGAAKILITIKGYKDVDSLLENDENLAAAAAARDAMFSVGNYVTFGTYPQTKSGNDETPIEWLVLDRDGDNALLLSRYGLDAQPYNGRYTDITWEKCTLRMWLNNNFTDRAFTAEEEAAILLTNVDNSSSQHYSEWDTDGGNNTQDRIFLLSYAEANKYLGVTYDDDNNTKSRVAPTAYALAQGAWTSDSNKTADGEAAGWWWLRSPGRSQHSASDVRSFGSLSSSSVDGVFICVRPALWVNLESGIF